MARPLREQAVPVTGAASGVGRAIRVLARVRKPAFAPAPEAALSQATRSASRSAVAV